jgi:hypothetical protein
MASDQKQQEVSGMSKRVSRMVGIAAVVCLALVAGSSAAVIIDDQFLDGSLDDGSNAGETDVQWYFYGGGRAWVVGTDNTAPLSGSTMANTGGSMANTDAIAQWSGFTLNGNGDWLEVSYDMRFAATPASGKYNILRLFNSNGTKYTQDELGAGITDYTADDDGYWIQQADTSTASTNGLQVRKYTNGTMSVTILTNSTAWANTNSHASTLRVTRLASGMQVDYWIDNAKTTYIDTSPPTYTFDTMTIRNNGGAKPGLFHVDNVLVTTIPEPSTLALFALLWPLAMFRRRFSKRRG